MSLHLELQKRNARLRAFRALGVPVEGGWQPAPDGRLLLQLRCLTCGGPPHQTFTGLERFAVKARGPHGIEGQLIRAIQRLTRCPHLAPLLQPDPPELAALLDLELLAGA
jgi:hypothetical protein